MTSPLVVSVGSDHQQEECEFGTYTQFQERRIREIVGAGNFDFVCMRTHDTDDSGKPRRLQPIMFMWYTTDGVLHCEKIGQQRILWVHKP